MRRMILAAMQVLAAEAAPARQSDRCGGGKPMLRDASGRITGTAQAAP